jgi:predicted small secreted protein
MKRIVVISLIVLLPLISACNTIKGVGKDITSVGEVLEDAAN